MIFPARCSTLVSVAGRESGNTIADQNVRPTFLNRVLMELTWSLALTVKPRQTSWPKRFSHQLRKIFMTQNLSIFLAFCMLYGNVRATHDRLDGTPEIKTKILIATFSVLYSHIVGNIKSKISKTIPGLRS